MQKQNSKTTNGWDRHEEHVLAELRRIGYVVKALDDKLVAHMKEEDNTVGELKVSLAKLETKIAIWGSIIAGAAAVSQPIISSAVEFLGK